MTQLTRDTPKPILPVEEFTECTKLAAAYFVQSVPFGDEAQSVSVGRNCDSILPVRLEADGSPVTISSGQRADGLLIRRKVHVRTTGARIVSQCFVPWANVRGLQYGAP